jgi:hypothetical protein
VARVLPGAAAGRRAADGHGQPHRVRLRPLPGRHEGVLQLKYRLPYSDASDISEEERTKLYGPNAPYEFSHTLEDQIGGQLDAGFVLTGFFEARKDNDRLGQYFPNYIATRAIKPR